jgi:hypothetical protein
MPTEGLLTLCRADPQYLWNQPSYQALNALPIEYGLRRSKAEVACSLITQKLVDQLILTEQRS